MERDVQEVEVMNNGVVAKLGAYISVHCFHVCLHVKHNRELPDLPQQLYDILQVHCADEMRIAAYRQLKSQSNATKPSQFIRFDNHLWHMK